MENRCVYGKSSAIDYIERSVAFVALTVLSRSEARRNISVLLSAMKSSILKSFQN